MAYSAMPPALDGSATASGSDTTAQFFAGVSADAGQTYGELFTSHDIVELNIAYAVEPTHINAAGSLFLVVELEGNLLMLGAQGFAVWDGAIATLTAFENLQSLEEINSRTVFSNLAFGTAGLAGKTFNIYLGYQLNSQPEELYFSTSALGFTIQSYSPESQIQSPATPILTSMIDASREREIPLLIYSATGNQRSPVLLFSHGLGGSVYAAEYLGQHWSARGYTVVFMQHPGSDESILEGVSPLQIINTLNAAATFENLLLRIDDVSAVIDQLETWNVDPTNTLYQTLDLEHIGMSGHSFGALTTQYVSGQTSAFISPSPRDPRIDAAVIFSPSAPSSGDTQQFYKDVDIPWLLMTGTEDVARIGNTTVAERLAVYPALPEGEKYELVLFEGEHEAFSDREITPGLDNRNPAHHPEIQAISSAFWDANLQQNSSARQWLKGESINTVLQAMDTWQFK